jgi:tRNA(Ile)-lysidine synthase
VSPEAAVEAALDRLAPEGPLGVAVSGGSDSTALLLMAADWARAAGRRLEAATVDHRLRPESAAEAARVARLCAREGIAHETLVWASSPGRGNLQAEARAARHRLLGAWAHRRGLAAVALGHTLDDQAETVLLRLARGSGVDGLSGMAAAARLAGALWLRPMLSQRRRALRDWLTQRGIGWLEDPANEDPRFDRVKARRALAALAPLGITAEGVAETARRLALQRRVLEAAMAPLAAGARRWGAVGEVRIDVACLLAAAGDTAFRLLADTLQRLSGGPHRPRQAMLERLVALLAEGRADGTLAGCRYRLAGGALVLWREAAAAAPPVPAEAGAVWDGRWRLAAAWPDGTLGALGEAGLSALREAAREGRWEPPPAWAAAPPDLLPPLPAIRAGGRLAAVPHAGFGPGAAIEDLAAPFGSAPSQ